MNRPTRTPRILMLALLLFSLSLAATLTADTPAEGPLVRPDLPLLFDLGWMGMKLVAVYPVAPNSAPCDLGREITRLPACTNPDDCPAYQLWSEHFSAGPMAAVPVDPSRLRAVPAHQGQGPTPRPWPTVTPCPAGR